MSDIPNNATRHRILDAAEALFASRGYAAVKLRDIGQAVGMRHASLYYYAPGGKEALYVEVMKRSMARHEAGMRAAIANAGPDISQQAHAVADWLLSQPPVDMARLQQSDLPELSPENGALLGDLTFHAMSAPMDEALATAHREGQIAAKNSGLAAMAFVTLIQNMRYIPDMEYETELRPLVHEMIDMLLHGWLVR